MTLRRTIALFAGLNPAYFVIEFTAARVLGAVSLFADPSIFGRTRR